MRPTGVLWCQMSSLSPRLQLRVAQKQILTPGLVQMVTVLQLNRLELKDMIISEIAQNPVLEESADGGEEITPEEVQAHPRSRAGGEPADQSLREAFERTRTSCISPTLKRRWTGTGAGSPAVSAGSSDGESPTPRQSNRRPIPIPSTRSISAASSTTIWIRATRARPRRIVEKPSFETFLSSPVTLGDHLRSQLSVSWFCRTNVRDAAESIIGNLDEDGYLDGVARRDRGRRRP